MPTVTLARNAMATRFEIVLHGENPVALRAAGEEALTEIERLEGQLSLFRSTSEIAHLNARAAREPVRVSPAVFALLEHARRLSVETDGAFDITIAPLMRCWGFMGGSGHPPIETELAEARKKVGMHLVELNPADFSVRFQREGVMLDLGAIGKGYAIEQGVEILREAGVTSALLHGGTSTVYGLGQTPEGTPWMVSIEESLQRSAGQTSAPSPDAPPLPSRVALKDEALSVSAVWGKYFEHKGRLLGHVLDPRTGHPASNAVLAAVVLPSATETDALSTALLTLGLAAHERISLLRDKIRTFVAANQDQTLQIASRRF
jgi:thiamine biosynthesis lipoprotein